MNMDYDLSLDITQFITIWNMDYDLIDESRERYMDFRLKLKGEPEITLELKDKILLLEVVDELACAIYMYNKYADKYEDIHGTTYYQSTKIYDEAALNCCSRIINYLENDIEKSLEDAYDEAVTNKWIKYKNNK